MEVSAVSHSWTSGLEEPAVLASGNHQTPSLASWRCFLKMEAARTSVPLVLPLFFQGGIPRPLMKHVLRNHGLKGRLWPGTMAHGLRVGARRWSERGGTRGRGARLLQSAP